MSDTTAPPATVSGTTPGAAKTNKTPGLVNQRQAKALTKAEQTTQAAKLPDRIDAMTARRITTEFCDLLATAEEKRTVKL